ncbi:hypothetical protein, partial [Pseudomonas kitaguniensis]|uniref:hypothetical protein n=1 Tax=Pseudomonas kitaguniensis TaxID=2607908 RepID=UPI003D09087D
IGPDVRIGLQSPLPVHACHKLANALPAGELVHGLFGLWIVPHGRNHQVRRSWPLLIELLTGLLQFRFLTLQNRQAFAV